MARRSAPQGTPGASVNPKGRNPTTSATRRTTRRKAGAVETATAGLVTALRKKKLLTPASEVIGAQAVALAATIDMGVREENAYAVQSASKELHIVLDKLRDLEAPANVTVDPMDELLRRVTAPPTLA